MNKFIAVDPASKNGDFACMVCAHINRNGTIIIDKIEYFKEKEVRKKMAIDYKEEWEKLQRECGHLTIIKNGCVTLGYVMGNMIRDTIDKREKLMEQYVKEHMTTEIDGGDKGYHTVNVIRLRRSGGQSLLAKVNVGKKEFEYWRNKKKGGK